MSKTLGTLFLVPTPLDFGCLPPGGEPPPLGGVLPEATVRAAAGITHWVTENAKSTRAFLKRVGLTHPLAQPLQAQQIVEMPRQMHKHGDHAPAHGQPDQAGLARRLLQPALDGHDLGLVSEAGMPAIADPGSSLVRAAHGAGVPVVPLAGPVSLMLALAASGLHGQHFCFVGYVPSDAGGRAQRIQALEQQAQRHGQTQILIETPYRNAALLQALVQGLQPRSRLAVCSGLTLPGQQVRSGPVAEWRRQGWAAGLPLELPSVFLIGA